MDFPTLETHYALIKEMKQNGNSYQEISLTLSSLGVERGASVANLKKFCQAKLLIKPTWGKITTSQLEEEVGQAVQQVGSTFGRKMMTGYLSSRGVNASEGRVGSLLKVVHPQHHQARQQGARNLNPTPYYAEYCGHKLHMDQNEKLAMFGVTHVIGIDGFSGKLVGYSTMPVKNNLLIYENVYRPAVLNHGLWDQLRTDCGGEFYLSLFIQESLGEYRFNRERPPFIQTPSTSNHRIERIWPEMNNRINYPLKRCLTHLLSQEAISMEDSTIKFCVSTLTCQIASVGLNRFVEAWNAHRIPGRGIPNVLAAGGCQAKLTEDLLPGTNEAVALYEQDRGTSLTRSSCFGRDPFTSQEERDQAAVRFNEAFPDIELLFESIVNDNTQIFEDALQHIINLTR